MKLENELKLILKKDIKEATNLQLYNAINELVKRKLKLFLVVKETKSSITFPQNF